MGNDLVTPMLEHDFPGLKAGDRWCLCVDRWKQALDAGVAPPVFCAAPTARALTVVTMERLESRSTNKNCHAPDR